MLQIPAQYNLRRRFPVFRGELVKHRLVQVPLHETGSRFQLDAVLLAEASKLGLIQQRVKLHLIDSRYDTAVLHNIWKLLTPIARTLPPLYSLPSAFRFEGRQLGVYVMDASPGMMAGDLYEQQWRFGEGTDGCLHHESIVYEGASGPQKRKRAGDSDPVAHNASSRARRLCRIYA